MMSPPLYWVGNYFAEAGILKVIEGFPFHRYFSRSVQISALVLLWPAFRWLRIHRLSELGIEPNRHWRRDLAIGFLFAFLPVLALGAGYFLTGVYELRTHWEGAKFFRVAGTACAVSVVEEFLFRCVFLGLCLMAMGRVAAVGLSAVFFAGVHFLKTSKQPLEAPVTWLSCFPRLRHGRFSAGRFFLWCWRGFFWRRGRCGRVLCSSRSGFMPVGFLASRGCRS